MGVYLAFTIPVAVFPPTDFPAIIVGVDNGVAPIDQMQVTVTRPIEEAMNSVPGPGDGAVDHQPRLGGNQSVLQLERGHVPDAAVRERGAGAGAATLPPTAKLTANRMTFAALIPIVGYSLTSDTMPQTRVVGTGELHHQAAPESGARRIDGGAAGRAGAGI